MFGGLFLWATLQLWLLTHVAFDSAQADPRLAYHTGKLMHSRQPERSRRPHASATFRTCFTLTSNCLG